MAIQTRVGWRKPAQSAPATAPPLDAYSGATVAYSVRKLRTAYSGSAIRVRRSSDNAEQNIGFTSAGDLDTASLLAFVGSGNGFVATWYDQSGNARDAYQTTASAQPQIVSAGALITNGGKPALRTAPSAGFFLNSVTIGTAHSFFALIDFSSGSKEYFGSYGNSWAFYQPNGEYKAGGSAGGATNAAFSLDRFLGSLHRTGQYMQYYQNSMPLGAQVTLSNATGAFVLSNLQGEGGSWTFAGDQQEAIVYSTNRSADRSAIESNMNSYFSIWSNDPDADAFIAAAGISNATQQSAIRTLVASFKSAGIWTKMKAIYPIVGGTAASHKFNLKDPRDLNESYRLVFGGGMAHSSTGILFGGANGSADTKFVISQAYPSSITNIHVSFYSRTNTSNDIMIGMQDDSVGQGSQIYLSDSGSMQTYSALNTDNNWVRTSNASSTTGHYIVSRTSMSLLKGYKNGSVAGTNTTPSLSSNLRSNLPILLGAQVYRYTSTSYYYGNKEMAFATIGDGLTDAEAAALYSAVQAFQTSLGRQV